MTAHPFTFAGLHLQALASGALWIAKEKSLVVSDLHFGKSDRIARRTGTLIPPYENTETLQRLDADISRHNPATVICLGDSFDDLEGPAALDDGHRATLARLQAGRAWIWIEGNHDPGPVDLGGTHLAETQIGAVAFRHIATPATPEVSGHYHPKLALSGAGRSRPCFVYDKERLILPAFGAYTGGLSAHHPDLRRLFADHAIAVMTGRKAIPVPLRR
ncbi:MAG: ligase-associated DNA damage response endonuclease PdeM [Pseudomonadota bacterium]